MQEINAQLFLSKGKASLPQKILISEKGILFKLASAPELGTREVLWSDLNLEKGGAGNKLIFFNFKNQEQISSLFFPANQNNLSILKAIKNHQVEKLLKSHRINSLINFTWILSFLSLVFVLIFCTYFFYSSFLSWLVGFVPFSYEQKIGDKVLALVVSPTNLVQNEDVLSSLRGKVDLLIKQMPKEMQGIGVYINKDESTNAFALPGGNIVFNTGLLKKADSIEEVLGVAAHELSHIQKRHVLKSLVQVLGGYLLIDLFLGNLTGVIAILTSNSEMILQKGFSRSQERDADSNGFNLLVKAGIDPIGMAKFFEIILAEQKKNEEASIAKAQSYLGFLSTHPETAERIEEIQKRRESMLESKKFIKIDMDYENFRKKVQAL